MELPNSDSSITYVVAVTNLGNTEMGIFSITGLPDNLEYTTGDFVVGTDKICEIDKCINGVEQVIYLTIQYKENGYTETILLIKQEYN